MLLSRYGDKDPPCLMRLPSAPEWRMMWRAAHEGRRPLPSLISDKLHRMGLLNDDLETIILNVFRKNNIIKNGDLIKNR
jgi:hypothetical protein